MEKMVRPSRFGSDGFPFTSILGRLFARRFFRGKPRAAPDFGLVSVKERAQAMLA